MNIDIVNKQVSKKLDIRESKVKLVNAFYWKSIREHIYSFNPKPVNIEFVCVFYPSRTSIKRAIGYYIKRIRSLQVSKRFKEVSLVRTGMIERHIATLKGFLKIRKDNKYTN